MSITPFFWFDNQAEEAAQFYVALFPDSRIVDVSRYQENTPGDAGAVMTVEFELGGQDFIALNGGKIDGFESSGNVSFMISCQTQADVDRYWNAFAEGGKPNRCGWVTDKFGITWQVVPTALPRLLGDPDREKASRAMQAMLQMEKLDIAAVEAAATG